MANRINVKLILELKYGGMSQNEIARSRHMSRSSISSVVKIAKESCHISLNKNWYSVPYIPIKNSIIDEWLLLKLNESESKNLFELIHKRRKKSSTIFCSQFREEGWYEQ